jgi:hypothetical protein
MLSFCIEKKRVWVVPLCMCMTGIHGFGSEWEKHKFYHNQSSTFHLILLPCIFVPFLYRLNILAELLCFGDREFYKDWWNAKTVEEVKDLLIIHACFFKKNSERTLDRADIVIFHALHMG